MLTVGSISDVQLHCLLKSVCLFLYDLPWHWTSGSPQKNSLHSRHVLPPNPGLQEHWPVTYGININIRQEVNKRLQDDNITHASKTNVLSAIPQCILRLPSCDGEEPINTETQIFVCVYILLFMFLWIHLQICLHERTRDNSQTAAIHKLKQIHSQGLAIRRVSHRELLLPRSFSLNGNCLGKAHASSHIVWGKL